MVNEDEITARATTLAGIISNVAAQIDTLRHRLDFELRTLINATAENESTIRLIVSNLNTISDEIDETRVDLNITTDTVDSVRDMVDVFGPDTDDDIQILETQLDPISQYVEQSVNDSRDAIQIFIDTQREKLDATVFQAGEELKDALAGALVSKITEFFGDLQAALSDQVRSIVDPVAAEIGSAVERLLDSFTQDLAHGDSATRHENAALDSAIHSLKPAVDSLLDEFKRVTALAHTVGF